MRPGLAWNNTGSSSGAHNSKRTLRSQSGFRRGKKAAKRAKRVLFSHKRATKQEDEGSPSSVHETQPESSVYSTSDSLSASDLERVEEVCYPLTTSDSSLGEDIDAPILYEQSLFTQEEKNVWIHNLCCRFSSVPRDRRNRMADNVAKWHLTSALEHWLGSDHEECMGLLHDVLTSSKCNLDVALRFCLEKANEGTWLPEEGEEKLSVKVKAARLMIGIVKDLCDSKTVRFWSDLLFATYLGILDYQPSRSEEDAIINKKIYLSNGEIALMLRTLLEKLKPEDLMSSDVTG